MPVNRLSAGKPLLMVLPDDALDQLFRAARTHRAWRDVPVSDETLRAAYDLMKWSPTASNSSPARIVFVRSLAAKEKLRPALDAGNVDKTMAAPATAIVAYDLEFYTKMALLSPSTDVEKTFVQYPDVALATAMRNGSLQGAYFILAARAVGLDCGPMSGFDNAKVDAAFFPGTTVKSNFLCNLGHGDPQKLRPRAPRLTFDEACRIE
jgi:3-hydroxypropanoate dehydrogenase